MAIPRTMVIVVAMEDRQLPFGRFWVGFLADVFLFGLLASFLATKSVQFVRTFYPVQG